MSPSNHVPQAVAPEERLIATLARLIMDPSAPPARHIAVGAASPMPAAACWLVKLMGHPVKLSLLHKRSGNYLGGLSVLPRIIQKTHRLCMGLPNQVGAPCILYCPTKAWF